MTEQMIQQVALEAVGTDTIRYGEHEISLRPPFARLKLREAARDAASARLGRPVSDAELRAAGRAAALAAALAVEIKPHEGVGHIAVAIVEALVEPALVQPTFVYDYPTEVSPLSKQRADDPDTVERFELYIASFEVANAFSELNDPAEQRRRFVAQLAQKSRGDEEAHEMDEDYIRALEYGLPPTGGEGVGIDRLVMLTDCQSSGRDLFRS
jgi:lysyl-tRNA synthetase class 2